MLNCLAWSSWRKGRQGWLPVHFNFQCITISKNNSRFKRRIYEGLFFSIVGSYRSIHPNQLVPLVFDWPKVSKDWHLGSSISFRFVSILLMKLKVKYYENFGFLKSILFGNHCTDPWRCCICNFLLHTSDG